MRRMILLVCLTASACSGPRAVSRAPQPIAPAVPVVQDSQAERVTVAFSNSSRPGLLRVDLVNGGIAVRAYSGKEVIIEARSRPRRLTSTSTPTGLRRIPSSVAGLQVEEQNNVMTVRPGNVNRAIDLDIQVPTRTNLKLASVNGGNIDVNGVDGEIEVDNTNGRVTVNNVAGSVVAHALNGSVVASLRQVTAGKSMSFTSQNGNVDVTLPQSIKANARMRSGRGSIFSDFDMELKPSSEPIAQDLRQRGGTYRLRIDNNVYGTINGGGPDLILTTFNGSIYVRKGK
jgi:putative adhesin